MPTSRPSYVIHSPIVPVTRFKEEILHQIRRTAARSILCLRALGELGPNSVEFRRTLASIVEQFGDDPHWENFMARALSYHADDHFHDAVEYYDKAITCIRNDPHVSARDSWQQTVRDIQQLRDAARNRKAVDRVR